MASAIDDDGIIVVDVDAEEYEFTKEWLIKIGCECEQVSDDPVITIYTLGNVTVMRLRLERTQ